MDRSNRRRWTQRLVTVALLGLLLATSGPRMLGFFTRQMLYPAPPVRLPDPPPPPLTAVRLPLTTGGETVAWIGPSPAAGAPAAGAPAALFFHGNGENLETLRRSGLFDQFAGLGVLAVAVEYPGYGGEAGPPRQASLVAAGEAALEWLADRHPERPRALVGWSLGAAVAVQVAAASARRDTGRRDAGRRDGAPSIERLALLSSWDDLPSLAAVHFPSWLVRIGLRDRWDSRAAAAEITRPTLVVHGADDRIIPVDHGRRLHAALPPGARWVEVPNTGHNDLLARPRVWDELGRWLTGR